MQVHVRYFAAAREATGRESELVSLEDGSTVDTLLEALHTRHETLAAASTSLRIALDEDFVDGDAPLRDGATVALIPPVGGG